MRIRQIALAARELDPVVEDLCAVLGIEVCFHDPGVAEFGLVNALMPVGDTFLEVVSPERGGTTAGRFLDRRGGDSGYMAILQTDDLAADRARVDALGVRVVWEIALPDISAMHLHPRDVGGCILSLDQPEPSWSWRWAGPDWEKKMRTGTTIRICGATLQSEDPEALASRWSEVLSVPARWQADATLLDLEGGELRFERARDGRGEGLAAVALEAADPAAARQVARERGLLVDDRISIGGTRFELLAPPAPA